jgi:type II secretory pathway component GspD/PulD (secretin)
MHSAFSLLLGFSIAYSLAVANVFAEPPTEPAPAAVVLDGTVDTEAPAAADVSETAMPESEPMAEPVVAAAPESAPAATSDVPDTTVDTEAPAATDVSETAMPESMPTAEPVAAAPASAEPEIVEVVVTPPAVNVEVIPATSEEVLLDLPLGARPTNGNGRAPTELISISLDAVPVPDVVNMFSRISGANIIVAGTFTNLYITANLKNVEWRSALNLALGSVNLSTIEDPSGIIMVVTSEMYQQKLKQIEETKPLVTRSFVLRYMNAVDLVEQIKALKILSPRGTIITSQSKEQHHASMKSTSLSTDVIQNPSITTEVIVSDIREYVDRVGALIEKLDKREPQVFIEARIIDVIVNDSKKLGFDWAMLDRFGVTAGLTDLKWTFSDESKQANTLANTDNQYDRRNATDMINKRYNISGQPYEESVTTYEEQPPGSGNWVSRTTVTPTRQISDTIALGRNIESQRRYDTSDTTLETKMGTAFLTVSEASLFLSALKKSNNANMISHPLLIVGNKVEAKIHVGERYPTVFTEKTTDSTGGIARDSYSEQVEWNDLGLTLWVIPEIDTEAHVVRMTVNPQMSTWVKDITTPQGSVYPVISTRHLSSRVNVPSTHTVVIGGLMEDSKSQKESRVPILGDIPLLGLLLRHTEDVVERSNLLIMLTPTILDESEPLTGLEAIGQKVISELEYTPLNPKPASPSQEDAAQTNVVSTAADEKPDSTAEAKTDTATKAEGVSP